MNCLGGIRLHGTMQTHRGSHAGKSALPECCTSRVGWSVTHSLTQFHIAAGQCTNLLSRHNQSCPLSTTESLYQPRTCETVRNHYPKKRYGAAFTWQCTRSTNQPNRSIYDQYQPHLRFNDVKWRFDGCVRETW